MKVGQTNVIEITVSPAIELFLVVVHPKISNGWLFSKIPLCSAGELHDGVVFQNSSYCYYSYLAN